MGAQCVSANSNDLSDLNDSTKTPESDSTLFLTLKFKNYKDYNTNLEIFKTKIADAITKIEFQNNFVRIQR